MKSQASYRLVALGADPQLFQFVVGWSRVAMSYSPVHGLRGTAACRRCKHMHPPHSITTM
jgi:hypothetical protein